MKVKLNNVRIAFCESIFEAKAFAGSDDKRYGAKFPIDPKSEHHKTLEAALNAVASEEWGATKGPQILAQLRKDGKVCYVLEPYTNKDGDVYAGFDGMYTLGAGQAEDKGRPLIVGPAGVSSEAQKEANRSYTAPNKNGVMFPILTARDGKPYSGCYVNATLEIWPQDNKFGRRINCNLKGLQFVKDGDAFGGGAPASPDDFDDLGVGEADSLAG